MNIAIIDCETTGLNPENSQLIEMSAICFDTKTGKMHPETFTYLIKRESWTGDAVALAMNHGILANSNGAGRSEFALFLDMAAWLKRVQILGNKVIAAGKNFAAFDLQFLKRVPDYGKYFSFHHRTIDPMMLFLDPVNDDLPPSLDVCLKRAVIDKKTSHTSLDDCFLVADLLRAGWHLDKRRDYAAPNKT